MFQKRCQNSRLYQISIWIQMPLYNLINGFRLMQISTKNFVYLLDRKGRTCLHLFNDTGVEGINFITNIKKREIVPLVSSVSFASFAFLSGVHLVDVTKTVVNTIKNAKMNLMIIFIWLITVMNRFLIFFRQCL